MLFWIWITDWMEYLPHPLKIKSFEIRGLAFWLNVNHSSEERDWLGPPCVTSIDRKMPSSKFEEKSVPSNKFFPLHWRVTGLSKSWKLSPAVFFGHCITAWRKSWACVWDCGGLNIWRQWTWIPGRWRKREREKVQQLQLATSSPGVYLTHSKCDICRMESNREENPFF